MEEIKKPKRPRIGDSQDMNVESGRFEKVTYNPNSAYASEQTRSVNVEDAPVSEMKQESERLR